MQPESYSFLDVVVLDETVILRRFLADHVLDLEAQVRKDRAP